MSTLESVITPRPSNGRVFGPRLRVSGRPRRLMPPRRSARGAVLPALNARCAW